MFKKDCVRKTLALILCLVLLSGIAALPVLAAPDEDPPAAPAAQVQEAPAEKEEAPAKEEKPSEKEEAPAKEEKPAEKEEAPAKEEKPSEKEEAPAKEEKPAEKEETPAKEEKPAEKEEAPAKEEKPSEKEEKPAQAKATPAPTKAPARQEEPEDQEPEDEPEDEPAALFGLDRDDGDDDGFVVDWAEVGTLPGGDWQVGEWGIARGDGGYWVYLSNNQAQISVGITYYNDASDAIRYRSWLAGGKSLLGENEMAIKDSTLTVIQQGNNYRMEGFIPDSFFKASRFILSSGNVTLRSEDIPRLPDATDMDLSDDVYNESHKEVEADTKAQAIGAAYTGITIDGDMSDWDAVPRYALKDYVNVNGDVKGYDTVDQVSVVWDGDYIYVLLVADGAPADYDPSVQVGNWNSVCGAGPNNNGQFAIVTDLNQQLLVQPAVSSSQEPTVSGIDDAQVAVNNKDWVGAPHMWEIAIPAEHLPKYLESFDFGLYLVEPAITGITNLQGGDDADKTFSGVVNDGKFDDWNYYPMTTIQYATAGTQDKVRDSHGALWADGKTLYGYVATDMVAHLGAHGSEFLGDIVLAFNGDRSYKEYPVNGNFYPRIVAFDDLDRISPNSAQYTQSGEPFITLTAGFDLADGDYTFYIFDTRTAPEAPVYDPDTNTTYYPTVSDLRRQAFGTIKIHVDGVLDQAEFALDLEKVADYIEADANDAFKVIEIQWGRLGQQWIACAGTPTGPILGVALLVGAVGVPMCYSASKKRRQAKKAADVAQ